MKSSKSSSFISDVLELRGSKEIPKAYFIGIGGCGMGALALYAQEKGWFVQGSDPGESSIKKVLMQRGVKIFSHQKGENLNDFLESSQAQVGDFAVVVYSTAIKADHEEFRLAKMLQQSGKIFLWHRSDFLRYILELSQRKSRSKILAIAGSHGKTTTTALIYHLLSSTSLKANLLMGGILQSTSGEGDLSHAMDQNGEKDPTGRSFFVVEADESDKSHLNFEAFWAGLITNMDPEHLSTYDHCEEKFYQSFQDFLDLAQNYGVVCGEDPGVRSRLLPKINKMRFWKSSRENVSGEKRVLTYGMSSSWDVYPSRWLHAPQGLKADVLGPWGLWKDLSVPLYGQHNLLNVLGAITMGWLLGLSQESIRRELATFPGVLRRSTYIGLYSNGSQEVKVFDDYAHHPSEIKATLESFRARGFQKILAIVELHRYSRLKDHFQEFLKAFDCAQGLVFLPFYGAGETCKAEDLNRQRDLMDLLGQKYPEKPLAWVPNDQDREAALSLIHWIAIQDTYDVMVVLGAGRSSSVAYELVEGSKSF